MPQVGLSGASSYTAECFRSSWDPSGQAEGAAEEAEEVESPKIHPSPAATEPDNIRLLDEEYNAEYDGEEEEEEEEEEEAEEEAEAFGRSYLPMDT